jgi:hypothetical protein
MNGKIGGAVLRYLCSGQNIYPAQKGLVRKTKKIALALMVLEVK